jgi:hypothetical protein
MQATCPICGGAIDLADDALFLTGCPHCKTVLPRSAEAWELLRLRAENERLRAELAARPVAARLFNRATYDELGEGEW